jgi:ATP-dependent 26S proteasome regulatory subunit
MSTTKLTGLDEISTLMNSRRRAILVNTYEEERVQEDLKTLAEAKGYHGFSWTITSGLKDIVTGEVAKKIFDPIKLMEHIQEAEEKSVFIIKDFHDIWGNFQAKRKLRDVLETHDNTYKPILLISPQASIPSELEKLITVVNYELPTRPQVIEQLSGMEEYLEMKELPVPEGREREAIIHGLVGMTSTEIQNVLKKSVAKNKCIDLSEITAEKEQVIRKTGLLEYITKLGDMKNVGGMDLIKDWLGDAYYAFEPEALDHNIDPVRGVVLAGFPGVGKSLAAKAIADLWNLPLLKMNMSDIMDSRVGQSEKNISRALKLAGQVSPCVMWIDEFEKGLSGIASSDRSDSGTLSRVVQELLTWLSDKEEPVFVVATANDVTKLPPELTRAGRFDELFFVSLPHEEERRDILNIHLRKRGYESTLDDSVMGFDKNRVHEATLTSLAMDMKDFSGAEIEQVVAEAGRRAYAAYRKGERESHYIILTDLAEQIQKMVPLAKRDPQLLMELRKWAKQSAKCASSKEHTFLHGEYKEENKSKLRVVNFPDIDLD